AQQRAHRAPCGTTRRYGCLIRPGRQSLVETHGVIRIAGFGQGLTFSSAVDVEPTDTCLLSSDCGLDQKITLYIIPSSVAVNGFTWDVGFGNNKRFLRMGSSVIGIAIQHRLEVIFV